MKKIVVPLEVRHMNLNPAWITNWTHSLQAF